MEHSRNGTHGRSGPNRGCVAATVFVLALLTPPDAAAVSRTCGADPIANTDDVLCASPSGPCSGSDVTLSAAIEVTAGGCIFDLGGRALHVDATFQMAGSGFIKVHNAGDVTISSTGKLKARGDFVQPQGSIIGGGLIEVISAGAIVHAGVIDVTGDPAGTVDLTATGDIDLQGNSDVRGAGQSTFVEEGARFADGATLEIVSSTGSVSVAGNIDLTGQNAATGGALLIVAATNVDIDQAIDASGGESDGGAIELLAGDDISITRRLDVSSRSGGGSGGTITLSAGDDTLGGAVPDGTLTINDVAMKLDGSSADEFGGDGGDFDATSTGPLVLTGTNVAIRASAGSEFDANGGSVGLEAGSASDLTVDGLIVATSGGAGGFGGLLLAVAGQNVALDADVDVKGKDVGGEILAGAGQNLSIKGSIAGEASSASGLGGEFIGEACETTVDIAGKIEVAGTANFAFTPSISLVGYDRITVRGSSTVDAGATGQIELRTRTVGGTCSNDPMIACQIDADCTVGCNTGTCEDINPDTDGTTTQFNPLPSTVEDSNLPTCN